MKTAAIIAEYNPFHNGHKFHIEEARRYADRIVVLMSGSFVQRGEPAVFSKWQRAEVAVKNGADLVLELPFFYSTAASPDFAFGAVDILTRLNVIDLLCFGTECGSIDALYEATHFEDEAFSLTLKGYLSKGHSYPAALEKASADCGLSTPNGPNDLLGSEYIRALCAFSSTIKPVCVKRTVSHDSDEKSGAFASASAVRSMLSDGDNVLGLVPEQELCSPLFFKDLQPLLYLAVKNLDRSRYSTRSLADDELLNTILNTPTEPDINSYLYNIKSKRYTMSRVKRTLLHILLNSGEKIPNFEPYARVLALNNAGRSVLSDIKKNSDIKIITKLDKCYAKNNPALATDIKAADIRSIALGQRSGSDFLTSPKLL